MSRIVVLLAAMLNLFALGCSLGHGVWTVADTSEDTDIAGPEPLACSGRCVTTAPATFTGPSLFWFGAPKLTPACPDETPHQGIEGYLDVPSPWFARECLITPTDACADEGETCAPVPAEDYRLCIHHADKADCGDTDYPTRSTMFDIDNAIEVTLCCQGSAVP